MKKRMLIMLCAIAMVVFATVAISATDHEPPQTDDAENSPIIVDASKLAEAIAEAENLNEDEYTQESWEALEAAILNAKEKLESGVQSEIDEAYSVLDGAINSLEAPDYSALVEAMGEAELIENNGYTTESWTAFIEATQKASETLNSRSQTEINAAKLNVITAMSGLKLPNYEELKKAIATSEALIETDYTEADWQALLGAIESSKEKLTSISQTEIDVATEALNSAVGTTSKLDREELISLVAVASAKVETDHTTESWTIFAKALAKANAILASRIQSDIDGGVAELAQAMNVLAPPDYSALKNSLNEAQSFNKDNYTNESWKMFVAAIGVANAALELRSQVEIDEAKVTLDAAIENLKSHENELDNVAVSGGCSAALTASGAVLATVLMLGMGFKKKD